MKRLIVVASVIALALGVVGGVAATSGTLHHGGDDNKQSFRAGLTGFQEVPSILTAGTADVRLTLDSAGTTLSYTLSYKALAGGGIQNADIQFAQPGVKGGLVAYLCGGGSKPACPASPATVSGNIVASDILGPAAQGLAAGDFAAALRALRSGMTYANITTAGFGGGEVRGQIRKGK
jgi:hypothetical protein